MKKKVLASILFVCMIIVLAPHREAMAAKHPEKYRNENVTPAKNQGEQGLCWAFACAAAMEAELLQNNDADEDIDFSELQLAYFSRNPAMDELGQMNLLHSGTYDYLDGASSNFLALTLCTGVSPVQEDKIPFSYDKASERRVLDEALAYTGEYYLKEVQIKRNLTNDEIKSNIKKFGAVVADFDGASMQNYNEKSYAWYNPDAVSPNHAVCIVGWDDNFSKKNFKTTPKGDGAWIVKNSWGEEWGENGFFYLSYYDTSISMGSFATFDMEPGACSDHIYQNAFNATEYFRFDENDNAYFLNGTEGCEKVANVFTACANDKGGELLKAVSFYTYAEAEYTIWIYKNVKENNHPESGVLAATLKGSIDASGLKIISLDEPLYLSEGESFSVVISAVDENGNYTGVATSGHDTMRLGTYGQSYALQWGDNWLDNAVWQGENLFINAYTDDVKKDAKADKKKVTMVQDKEEVKKLNLPENVTGLKAAYADSTSVVLSWDKTDAENYVIYRYNSGTKTWHKIGFSEQNYYKVTGLKGETSYTFGVKVAEKGNVLSTSAIKYLQSPEYAQVKVTTASSKQITPNVEMTENGNVIKWSKVSGANKYVVYVLSPETDFIWQKLKTVKNGATLKYTDKNVIPGLTYMYRVYSYKDSERLSRGVPVSVTYE